MKKLLLMLVALFSMNSFADYYYELEKTEELRSKILIQKLHKLQQKEAKDFEDGCDNRWKVLTTLEDFAPVVIAKIFKDDRMTDLKGLVVETSASIYSSCADAKMNMTCTFTVMRDYLDRIMKVTETECSADF